MKKYSFQHNFGTVNGEKLTDTINGEKLTDTINGEKLTDTINGEKLTDNILKAEMSIENKENNIFEFQQFLGMWDQILIWANLGQRHINVHNLGIQSALPTEFMNSHTCTYTCHTHAHIVKLFENINFELVLLKIFPLWVRGTPCICYMDIQTQ